MTVNGKKGYKFNFTVGCLWLWFGFLLSTSELTLWLAFLNRKLNSTACSVAKILPSKLFLAISFVVFLCCIDNCCFKKCSVYCSWQQNRHSVRRFGGRTSCCARLDSHHWVNFNSVCFFDCKFQLLFSLSHQCDAIAARALFRFRAFVQLRSLCAVLCSGPASARRLSGSRSTSSDFFSAPARATTLSKKRKENKQH